MLGFHFTVAPFVRHFWQSENTRQLAINQASANEKFHADPYGRRSPTSICAVCLDEPASHAFPECGHRCVCAACGDALIGNGCRCPICRTVVASCIRIYS